MNARSQTCHYARARWTPRIALTDARVRPSKGRGQNFLVQPRVADRIVAAAELSAADIVIEIGPGLGILSERIAARPLRKLVMIELDPRLAENLRTRFKSETNLEVVQSDFLELDPRVIRGSKIIGNLPFNCAAAIVRRLCEYRGTIRRMVLTFQREVGERIRAQPGDPAYGVLSVMTALYWKIDSHFRVGAGNFYPRPKVDAEVLVFRPCAQAAFRAEEEHSVLATIRASFTARRKTIRNALSNGLALAPRLAADALVRARIDPDARAETLAAADFVRLTRALAYTAGPLTRT